VTAALDTYAELRLAEGKLLRWGERPAKAACALQPRDLEILVALARYRFLTTGQIAELWWEGRGLRAARRRMTRLFEAGFVERFRPQTLRGSYQWTYCLARDGFRAAEQTGELPPSLKFAPRREAIFDYRYVIHDLRVNEWVLRYREVLGDRLLDWAGPDESLIEPPRRRDGGDLGDADHNVYGVDDDAVRPVQPDALLLVAGAQDDLALFVEYDRTRRVDKNYDKFRRYEAFLAGWWPSVTPLRSRRPAVVFICQDDDHRQRFVDAATGSSPPISSGGPT
jgi:Replication-relaxation